MLEPGSLSGPLPRIALAVGVVAFLVVDAAAIPLAALAHHLSDSLPIFLAATSFAAVGCFVAHRQPRNPVGWLMLALGASSLVGLDAISYALLRYRLGHAGLPIGLAAVFLTPLEWASVLLLLPLPVLLFPDGRLSRPWRRLMWGYLAIAGIWLIGIVALDVDGLVRPLNIDSSGSFVTVDTPPAGWERFAANGLVVIVYAALALASAARQLLAFRGSTGERRQQLKWLLAAGGSASWGCSRPLLPGATPQASSRLWAMRGWSLSQPFPSVSASGS